jgi:hypothetical protein
MKEFYGFWLAVKSPARLPRAFLHPMLGGIAFFKPARSAENPRAFPPMDPGAHERAPRLPDLPRETRILNTGASLRDVWSQAWVPWVRRT